MTVALPVIQRDPGGGASMRGSHRLALVKECGRAWFFRWVMRLEGKAEQTARFRGTLIHLALSYYHASLMEPGTQPQWYRDNDLATAMKRAQGDDEESGQIALAAHRAYMNMNPLQSLRVVSVEQEFVATIGEIRANMGLLPGPFDSQVISSRLDLLCEANGGLHDVDIKTLEPRSKYGLGKWNSNSYQAVSFQFPVHAAILNVVLPAQYGMPLKGIWIRRVSRRAPFDTDLNPINLSPMLLADLPRTLESACEAEQQIVDAFIASGKDPSWLPVGNYWACYSYGHVCEYRAVCAANTPEERTYQIANSLKAVD